MVCIKKLKKIISKQMDFKFVDNHAHLNFAAFKDDLSETITRAKEAGVAVINVGTQRDTSKRAVEITEEFDNCYAIIGLHPVHTNASHHDEKEIGEGGSEFTSRGEIFDYEYYKELVMHPKVVGIGECGFDYYGGDIQKANAAQRDIFESHVRLAHESGKPLMLHIRPSTPYGEDAYRDTLSVLKNWPGVRGNVHFFAGTKEVAKEFLDLGFTLSFTGVITFAKDYEELVRYIPIDRILSETDCPYVSPVPYRGKRNEPAYVVEVVKKIAEIKNLSLEEVSVALLANSKKLFNI